MKSPKSVLKLDQLGRVRLSPNFFMRDFLYSEIANLHGLPNIPDDPNLAISAGTRLCEELLEPLNATFGRIAIRSAYRSPSVNTPRVALVSLAGCNHLRERLKETIGVEPHRRSIFGWLDGDADVRADLDDVAVEHSAQLRPKREDVHSEPPASQAPDHAVGCPSRQRRGVEGKRGAVCQLPCLDRRSYHQPNHLDHPCFFRRSLGKTRSSAFSIRVQ